MSGAIYRQLLHITIDPLLSVPITTHSPTGCDFNTCFSDTWALDLTAVNPEWFQLLDTSNTSDPYPDARFTVAGGVYPGSSQLWLSMGEGLAGRKLSDTWILQINDTEEELTGMTGLT